MKRWIACSIAVLSILAASTIVEAKKPAKPANPLSNAFGHSLTEWQHLFWTWTLGSQEEPGREGNVVYLPIPAGEPVPYGDGTVFVGETEFSLRHNEKFVLPVFAFVGETYLEEGIPDDDAFAFPPELFTEADILVTLDGEPILTDEQGLEEFFFGPTFFEDTIFYAEPVEYAEDVHAIGAIWVQGVGFVYPNLKKGSHTLELFVFSDVFGLGFNNTWHLTVE